MLKFQKVCSEAVIPSKAHVEDAGYDLTAIRLIRTEGNVEYYDTGIVAAPPEGYYLELYARSSLPKYNYMVANSVGVIDNGYRGPLIIALVRIRSDGPQLQLPQRIAQIIPKKTHHLEVQVCTDLIKQKTDRGTRGFGSSGNN